MYRSHKSNCYIKWKDWYNTLSMSIVCISGKNEYREKETLQRVLKENKIPSDKVVYFDASNGKDFNIDSVMIECNMFSLFDNEPKAVIV